MLLLMVMMMIRMTTTRTTMMTMVMNDNEGESVGLVYAPSTIKLVVCTLSPVPLQFHKNLLNNLQVQKKPTSI